MIIYEKLQYELNRAATKHFEAMQKDAGIRESVKALSIAAEAYTRECARMTGKTLDEFFEDVAHDEARAWHKDMRAESNKEMLDRLQKAAKGGDSRITSTESSPVRFEKPFRVDTDSCQGEK